MSGYDTLIRGGSVVTTSGIREQDVAVSGGVVVGIEPEMEGGAAVEIDASGLHVLPGLIDAHVHFNEPGRTHWEGFETGSRALAAGGATMVFDMPLNSYPPTVDGPSFDLKREAGERSALVDFALWGAIQPDDLIGYFEVHIEQGPVLEELDLPVGVVTAIAGQSRVRAGFTGQAGHAGTVPMQSRKDALCAAAELVLEVERAARVEAGSVGTVGQISALPGAGNVVPGEAQLSLDIRHQNDEVRVGLRDHLEARTREIADARDCEHEWQLRQETSAVPVDEGLSAALVKAVEGVGINAHRLPSGAGHDAAQIAALTPVAMLFVRCKDGISHNPEESVTKQDVGVALDVMTRFLEFVAGRDR